MPVSQLTKHIKPLCARERAQYGAIEHQRHRHVLFWKHFKLGCHRLERQLPLWGKIALIHGPMKELNGSIWPNLPLLQRTNHCSGVTRWHERRWDIVTNTQLQFHKIEPRRLHPGKVIELLS